jgi:predicted ATPase/DNA-binding SARP family transcriptional activator
VVSRLAFYLLGPPRIECDGEPVKLDRRKAIALTAFLAVTGESQRRDTLVNLLWPDYDSSRGRAALRRTLYALRNALCADWLAVDRDQIGLDPGATPWVDVSQFHQHVAACETHGHSISEVCSACAASLTDAVALVRGDFLSGFSLKDSANFDDWQLFQAEALRRELAGALERLVRWHSAQREFELAVGYARHKLALDPLDEPAHCQLMCLYAWSGRRTAALRQYKECVAILDDQLGVSPQSETIELFQNLQEARSPAPPERWEQVPIMPSGRLSALAAEPPSFLKEDIPVELPVFVARDDELAQLNRHLDAALSGQGKVIFVTGDAGCGKTALIHEFARRAQADHADLIVATGLCNAHTGVGDPYLPFREVLGLLTGDIEAQWAAGAMTREQARRLWQLLPLAVRALAKTGPDLIGLFLAAAPLLERAITVKPWPIEQGWLTQLETQAARAADATGAPSLQQSALFEQYTQVLRELAGERPLLLALDDLQWADDGSINLLFHLGRRIPGSRILLMGAYRPAEIALGRPSSSAPREPSMVWSQAARERHPLEPIVSEFQRAFGDIAVNLSQTESQDFVDALLDSEPNCLSAEFQKLLYRQTRGHPLFTLELLRGLQERGNLVQDQEGRWIEGHAFDWDTLPARVEAVIAERIGRLPDSLRVALRIASVEGEVFTAEVVARVGATDDKEILRRFSRELDRRHRLIRAQSIQRTAGRLVSRYRFRHILFQRYLYSSLDDVERVHLHEQIGTAIEQLYGTHQDSTPTPEIAEVAPQLARHFQEAQNTAKAIRYLHLAGDRAVQLSAFREARAHLTTALELLLTLPDSPERDQKELALQLSLGIAWMGTDNREAEKAYSRSRELCLQTGLTSDLHRILGQLSTMHYVGAKHHRACELVEETIKLAEQTGDPLLNALGHWRLGFIHHALGDFAASRAHLERMIAFYEPQHHRSLVLLSGADGGLSAMAYHACCLWVLGYPEQASKRSEEALALAMECDHPFTLADVLTYGGCLFQAMLRNASALLNHAEALVQLATERGFVNWMGNGAFYRGQALTMLGEVEEGIAQLREGVALLRQGIAAHEAYDAVLNLPIGLCALAEAQAMYGQPEEGLTTLHQALAIIEETDERQWEVELRRLRAELLLMLGQDADAEASLRKAVEVARRQRAKSWELRATTSLARLWQQQGHVDRAWQALFAIYDWFTEGFDTRDLREARALLDELS